MKITNVQIQNFRLLNNSTVHLDDMTTVLVGKNNSGKTSFSYVIQSFLNNNNFMFEDFSIKCHSKFVLAYKEYVSIKDDLEKAEDFFIGIDKKIPSIELHLEIEYGASDNWSNIRPLLTTLDNINKLYIRFSYEIKQPQAFLEKIYTEMKKAKSLKKYENSKIIEIVSKIHHKYFGVSIKPISKDAPTSEIKYMDIKKIISSHFIAAQRNVEDGNSKINTKSKLAPVFQQEYKNSEQKKNIDNVSELEQLNEVMNKANNNIDIKLAGFFKNFTNSFATFGYPNIEGVDIILKSNVTPTNLFSGIQLFYKDKEYLLPEKYNGLGYSNLIYIISEILSFKSRIEDNPTDLNLIFIEEPEAHMHPQLQNTFILKLNDFLMKNNINAQVIISTHSSHMVSNAQFESIRYLSRDMNNVEIKDLLKFKIDMELKSSKLKEQNKGEFDSTTIQFLKKYITLVKCDMFFADKIILVEGLCERLLMPLFVQKVDQFMLADDKYKKIKQLSEQYISVIEIGGAYMHKFKEFLEFLNIKTLIITDIDSCIETPKKDSNGAIVYLKDNVTPKVTTSSCPIVKSDLENLFTSNQTLIKWIPQKRSIKDLIFEKFNISIKDPKPIAVTYQKNYYSEKEYIKCGRSFEEAFIIDNCEYVLNQRNSLDSIKNKLNEYNSKDEIFRNSYEIYSYIDKYKKKSDFAFDLMYVSPELWNVPAYIKEGLIWLAM